MDSTESNSNPPVPPPPTTVPPPPRAILPHQYAQAFSELFAGQDRANASLRDAERAFSLLERSDERTQALLNALTNATRNSPVSGPREWRPPHWDGLAGTFRDYLIRVRSSYQVQTALNPSLPGAYYWDCINDSLPYDKRARMRSFWGSGGTSEARNPVEFFTELESVFADSMEKTKALERLVKLRHQDGQPWHEHQLLFDELLHASHGDLWVDPLKIQHLKGTFSDKVTMNTVSMNPQPLYTSFVAEVGRIMANYENTLQFLAKNKAWASKHGSAEGGAFQSVHGRPAPLAGRVDSGGDTIMTPLKATGGDRARRDGSRSGSPASSGSNPTAPRAKWVTKAVLTARKDKDLCFRCGGSAHRASECPYRPAVNPAKSARVGTNVASFLSEAETPPELEDSGSDEPGKE